MKYPYVLCAYPRDFRQTGKGAKKVGKFADLQEAETCGEALLALHDDFHLPKYERYFVYDRVCSRVAEVSQFQRLTRLQSWIR